MQATIFMQGACGRDFGAARVSGSARAGKVIECVFLATLCGEVLALHTLDDEYDLVLEGNEEASIEIAKQYLEEAGIPTLLDQPQASAGALGAAQPLTYARLFVPKGMRARAEAVLVDLRGQSQELDELVQAGLVPGSAVSEKPALSRETMALLAGLALAIAALVWFALHR